MPDAWDKRLYRAVEQIFVKFLLVKRVCGFAALLLITFFFRWLLCCGRFGESGGEKLYRDGDNRSGEGEEIGEEKNRHTQK